MSSEKYIGLDVHQATISVAVLDQSGKLVMESVIDTKAATILDFVHGLRRSKHVTFDRLMGPVICCGTFQDIGRCFRAELRTSVSR